MPNQINDDRAITINFSLRLSTLNKLGIVVLKTRKKRSELISEWIEKEYEAVQSQPETKVNSDSSGSTDAG